MKALIQTLFFLLVTQICFAQWVQVGLNDKSIKDIEVNDAIIFAATSDSGKVYRSIDNGSNWTTVVDSCAVDVEISLTGKVFMTKDSLLNYPYWNQTFFYSSLNNGATWTQVNITEQIKDSLQYWWISSARNIAVSPSGIIFCQIVDPTRFGPFDVLAKSTDDGLNWTTPGEGVIAGKLFDFVNQFVITLGVPICCTGPHIHISSDYGSTWNLIGYTPYGVSNTLNFFPNGNFIVGGELALYISTDTCSTWEQISTLNCQIGLTLTNGSTERILIGTDSLGVFVFSDEGDSLGARNGGLTSLNVQALALDNSGYIYAGTGDGVWRRPLSEFIPVELISFSATSNDNEVILSWSTATETNNQGFSVERKSSTAEYSEIGFVPGFGTTTEPKLYCYTDSKVSSERYNYRLKQIDFDGSYEYSPEVEIEVAAPLEFSLEQNFPNPFNPITTIGFSVPTRSNIRVTIFNAIGEEVFVLLNEERETGFYKLEFNAATLPSGFYLYQLKAGNYLDTKKMILLR